MRKGPIAFAPRTQLSSSSEDSLAARTLARAYSCRVDSTYSLLAQVSRRMLYSLASSTQKMSGCLCIRSSLQLEQRETEYFRLKGGSTNPSSPASSPSRIEPVILLRERVRPCSLTCTRVDTVSSPCRIRKRQSEGLPFSQRIRAGCGCITSAQTARRQSLGMLICLNSNRLLSLCIIGSAFRWQILTILQTSLLPVTRLALQARRARALHLRLALRSISDSPSTHPEITSSGCKSLSHLGSSSWGGG